RTRSACHFLGPAPARLHGSHPLGRLVVGAAPPRRVYTVKRGPQGVLTDFCRSAASSVRDLYAVSARSRQVAPAPLLQAAQICSISRSPLIVAMTVRST